MLREPVFLESEATVFKCWQMLYPAVMLPAVMSSLIECKSWQAATVRVRFLDKGAILYHR